MKTEKTIKIESFRMFDSQSFEVSNLNDADKPATVSSISSAGFRCSICFRLLAKRNRNGAIAGEIKCSRCGTINEI